MSGVIYFIACEQLSAVKIGFTSGDPLVRLSALQTGCPTPLKLLGAVSGTQGEERALHLRYATRRMQGEWFRIDPNGCCSLNRLLELIDPQYVEVNGLLYGLGLLERRAA